MGENLILSAEHCSVVQKQGSRGLVAERCLYAEIMENRLEFHPKIDEKSMKNRCKIDARKSDANIMKKHRKSTRKGSRNPCKFDKKRGPEMS